MPSTRLETVLPEIEDMPQTVCRICGVSKIRGLFTPLELANVGGQGPRCRLCIGDVNARHRIKLGSRA
jgi:hypothetical protein